MKIVEFLILALATWRITSLLYAEDGPYRIFARLRKRAGVYYDEHSQRQGDTELAKALNCPACLSVWIGSGVLAYYLAPTLTIWLCLPLALSAAAIIIERIVGNGES